MLIGPTWLSMLCTYFWLGCAGLSPQPLLVISGPRDLVRFELRDAYGETVWAVEAIEPQTLKFIAYGVTPVGFEQRFPSDGTAPRELRPGEIITTETRSLRRVFIHRGHAAPDGRFEISDWSMHLLDPP